MNDSINRKNSYVYKTIITAILLLSMCLFWAGSLGLAYMLRADFLFDENIGTKTQLACVTENLQTEALYDYINGNKDSSKKTNFHYVIYQGENKVAGNVDSIPEGVNSTEQTVKCGKYSHFTFGETTELGAFISPDIFSAVNPGTKDVKYDISDFGISDDNETFYAKSGDQWYELSKDVYPQVSLSGSDSGERFENTYAFEEADLDMFADNYGVNKKNIKRTYVFYPDTEDEFTLSESKVKTVSEEDTIADKTVDTINSNKQFTIFEKDDTEQKYTITSYYGQKDAATPSNIGSKNNGKYRIDLAIDDLYSQAANQLEFMHSIKPGLIIGLLFGAAMGIISFLLLLAAAGHHKNAHPNAKEENYIVCADGSGVIEKRGLDFIPLDLYALILLMTEGVLLSISAATGSVLALIIFTLPLGAIAFLVFIVSVAINYKVGTLWKNTICCRILDFFKKLIARAKVMWAAGNGINELKTRCFMEFGILFFLHLLGFAFVSATGAAFLAFFAFIAIWVYMGFRVLKCIGSIAILKEGTNRVAAGDFSHRIDADDMPADLQQMANNVNHIGAGLDKAVEERMKSEHMQTELITNVSHDIRTPLTSIINYVDLLSKEEIKNEKANEYLEVINRQALKLKKLISDLIDASKASSGAIELNLEKMNAAVLLTQAVGEFSEALSEKNIEMLVESDDEEMYIEADAQQLWRIFDNLLGNAAKYGQPGTRAYVDVESVREGSAVQITFRNISEQPLHISGEELMQRFVRGDESRSTQGSGLGLSIAKSLTELMNGTFDLTVDGDLFKVILTFEKFAE